MNDRTSKLIGVVIGIILIFIGIGVWQNNRLDDQFKDCQRYGQKDTGTEFDRIVCGDKTYYQKVR